MQKWRNKSFRLIVSVLDLISAKNLVRKPKEEKKMKKIMFGFVWI